MQLLPKDFIATDKQWVFTIVMPGLENDRALCFLRYIRQGQHWQKLTTAQANAFLQQQGAEYLYYSPKLDAQLHAVPVGHIVTHYRPRQRLQQVLQTQHDDIERDACYLVELWQQHGIDVTQFGLTGSLLIGAQQATSDIDIVCYDATSFHRCRQLVADFIQQGRLTVLSDSDWRQAYQRRATTSLTLEQYIWHEQRKYNKAMVNGRKFDISLVSPQVLVSAGAYQKCGRIKLTCTVTDDSKAFDYPAEFGIDAEGISHIVSYTATYIGQAQCGEYIDASGWLEVNAQGDKRILVGSSREADEEYIIVFSSVDTLPICADE
jgi:uncharacterized protein